MAATPTGPAGRLSPADQAALVARWDDFAHKMVRAWAPFVPRRSEDYRDVLQEARLGLVIAACKFEPARGLSFGTLAGWWCRARISRWLYDRRPAGTRRGLAPVPTLVSLSAQSAEGDRPLEPAAPAGPNPDVGLDAAAVLAELEPADREVLELRYVRGLTQRAAAGELGLTREQLRGRERAALRDLRELFAEDPPA